MDNIINYIREDEENYLLDEATSSSYCYPCLVYRQRNAAENTPTFCFFHAPVGEILQWAAIKRLEDEAGAPQRRASPAKVAAIKNFLKSDQMNTIPTSVIITLDLPGYEVRSLTPEHQADDYIGFLEFDVEDNKLPGLVIDGQHRLLGVDKFGPEISINVVVLLNADDTEKAFQFLVINNKISKVSTDHIRALALHYEKQQLNERLKTARMTLDSNLKFVGAVDSEEDSPFRGIIAWPTNPKDSRIIPPSAIELAITYIQKKGIKSLENDDVLLEFFYAIWRPVKEMWAQIWHKESKLLLKVGVVCLTRYITDALVSSFDWGQLEPSEPEQVATHVKMLLKNQEPEFWVAPWVASSYDTKGGQALIVESLVIISRNLRDDEPWYTEIKMVDIGKLKKEQKNI